jgi:hypothetical protein
MRASRAAFKTTDPGETRRCSDPERSCERAVRAPTSASDPRDATEKRHSRGLEIQTVPPILESREWVSTTSDRMLQRSAMTMPLTVTVVPSQVAVRRAWALRLLRGSLLIAATVGAMAGVRWLSARSGEVDARQATSLTIGDSASAVLGRRTHVKWDGGIVDQTSGRASWIVAPGRQLRVRTPAGEVTLDPGLATIKVRPATATTKAHVFVAVEEGRATLPGANGSGPSQLAAGESADLGPDGMKPLGDPAGGERVFDDDSPGGEMPDDGLSDEKAKLSNEVRDYKKRLEDVSQQKSSIEQKLKAAEDRLAEREGKKPHSPYDLTKDDWAELAEQGIVRYRFPCTRPDQATYTEKQLVALGLTPGDGAILTQAHQHSTQRVWDTVRPLCQEALGNASVETVERLGFQSCKAIITSFVENSVSMDELFQLYVAVGEMRAGKRPIPGPNEKVSPLVRLLLALSGENAEFEAELTKHLGPEDAHRIAYADGYCASHGSEQGGNAPPAAMKKRDSRAPAN